MAVTATTPGQVWLSRGSHDSATDGLSLVEAVAAAAGEPHSSFPRCLEFEVACLAQLVNDQQDDASRQDLITLVPALARLPGVPNDDRRFALCDWIIRDGVPGWLRTAGMDREAQALEDLDPVTSWEATAAALQPCAQVAYEVSLRARELLEETYRIGGSDSHQSIIDARSLLCARDTAVMAKLVPATAGERGVLPAETKERVKSILRDVTTLACAASWIELQRRTDRSDRASTGEAILRVLGPSIAQHQEKALRLLKLTARRDAST